MKLSVWKACSKRLVGVWRAHWAFGRRLEGVPTQSPPSPHLVPTWKAETRNYPSEARNYLSEVRKSSPKLSESSPKLSESCPRLSEAVRPPLWLMWARVFILSLAVNLMWAQQPGSTVRVAGFCQTTVNFTAAAQVATIDNRFSSCAYWTFNYAANGFSALSILVESANDNGGTPGTWVSYSGSVVSGSNPNTATTTATTTLSGFVPWIRVRLTSVTGTGTLYGILYGQLNAGNFTGSVTATTNLSSAATAQADASSNSPRVLVDGSGNAMTNPAYKFLFNGTNWDRARGNTLGAFVQGNLAANQTITANPLLIGVEDQTGKVQNAKMAFDDYSLPTQLAGTSLSFALADGQSNTQKWLGNATVGGTSYLGIPTFAYHFGGTTWDRARGNTLGAFIQGNTDVGSAVNGKPIQIGFSDGTNVRRALSDTGGRAIVIGAAASGATAVGNPVQTGGVFNTTQPTVTTGQAVEAQYSARGAAIVAPGVEGFRINGANGNGIIACDQTAKLDMSTATTTEIVAASGSTVVYICMISMEAAGTTTATLKYGTGTNCGTGTTSLGPAWEWTAQTGIVEGSGLGMVYKTPASQAVCVTNSAAVNLHVHVAYTQF